ncbi:MAG: tetratricopeptide repeat protein [Candidatus Eisenbacteria bacterium]|nr:tetratricopeptide repeat protein [Candidatus Eisenbacteria bacterium]
MRRNTRFSALVLLAALLPAAGASAVALPTAVRVERASEFFSRYSIARLMELEGLYSSALVQYRRAESVEPGHCETRAAIARVLLSMRRLDEAREAALEAEERCPEDLEVVALRARIELADERPAVAESLLVALTERGDPPRRITVLLAGALVGQDRAEEAEALLAERAAEDSLAADIAFEHARTLLLLDRVDEALAELRRSHHLDPTNPSVAGLLSRLLLASGHTEEGVRLLERFLGSGASESEYIALARGYSELGRPERALEVLDEVTERDGMSEAVVNARASILFAAGDSTAAIGVYEQVLEENPESVPALNFVAYTLAEWGTRLDDALRYARKAVALEPDDPRILDTLGWVYYKLGRYEDAVRELERAIEAGAEDPVIFEHLADAYEHTGRVDEARAMRERARRTDDQEDPR